MPDREFRSYEDVTAEILGRYSVTDLYEQQEADLVVGDVLFYKAKFPVEVVDQGETNGIRWWRVLSGEKKFYEVRRFKNFVWCSCKGFFFTKRMCKHAAVTTGVYCERCREMSAKVGKLCRSCDNIVNRFLRPSPEGQISATT